MQLTHPTRSRQRRQKNRIFSQSIKYSMIDFLPPKIIYKIRLPEHPWFQDNSILLLQTHLRESASHVPFLLLVQSCRHCNKHSHWSIYLSRPMTWQIDISRPMKEGVTNLATTLGIFAKCASPTNTYSKPFDTKRKEPTVKVGRTFLLLSLIHI